MTRALLDRTGLTHCTHTAFWYGISSEFSGVFDAQPPSAFPINRKCVRCLWCQVDLPLTKVLAGVLMCVCCFSQVSLKFELTNAYTVHMQSGARARDAPSAPVFGGWRYPRGFRTDHFGEICRLLQLFSQLEDS